MQVLQFRQNKGPFLKLFVARVYVQSWNSAVTVFDLKCSTKLQIPSFVYAYSAQTTTKLTIKLKPVTNLFSFSCNLFADQISADRTFFWL